MSSVVSHSSQPGLTIRRAADVVAEPISWTVDQILPGGMLTILSGKDKAGKTLFAWEIARAVCRGENFMGQFPTAQGPVLFLGLDDPATVTVDRLEQLGIQEAPDLYLGTPLDCQPNHVDFWPKVREKVEGIAAQLVVVDALYLFLRGGSDAMNQAGGMAPVMEPLNKIAEETGASVLLITHDSKSGGDVAGSFVIRAAAKQILRLIGISHQPSMRSLQVEGKIIERCEWILEFNGPGSWKLANEGTERLTQTKGLVKSWLQSGNRGTVEVIARAISKRPADVRTVLGLLQKEEQVLMESVRRGRGRPAQEFYWNSRPKPIGVNGGTENTEILEGDVGNAPEVPNLLIQSTSEPKASEARQYEGINDHNNRD